MEDGGLTRRQANRILLGGTLAAAGAGSGLVFPAHLLGQPTGRGRQDKSSPANPPPPKSFLADVIKKGKTHDWIFKPTVHVQAYQEDPNRAPNDRPLIIGQFSFSTAAVVFPVLKGTASSEVDTDGLKSELTFNDATVDAKPDFNDSYQSGVRLGRWEMRDKTGREVELKLEIPMTCWETIFDEKTAAKAVWPAGGAWPRMAQATFAPQAKIDVDEQGQPSNSQALKDLVSAWTQGKDPKSVSPLLLAKTFAGKVVEQFQPSGNGEDYDKQGSFIGLLLQGPAETIRRGTGSPHDIVSVLVGAYRAAGLPARLVIGYDETDNKGDNSTPFTKRRGGVQLRSWAEFCLYDETNQTEVWVPVDPIRMRRRSSKIPSFDQPWKYFGSHDELDSVMPFAFHFIPPTTVISYGYAFWGWFTTPSSQIGDHWLRFQSQTAPKRAQPKQPAGGRPSR